MGQILNNVKLINNDLSKTVQNYSPCVEVTSVRNMCASLCRFKFLLTKQIKYVSVDARCLLINMIPVQLCAITPNLTAKHRFT